MTIQEIEVIKARFDKAHNMAKTSYIMDSFDDIPALIKALEAETKRADKWEKGYRETSERLDEVLDDTKEGLKAVEAKVTELQADRDHWKARSHAMERAIKTLPPDCPCDLCIQSDVRSLCTDCDDWQSWGFAQERFTAKGDGDD